MGGGTARLDMRACRREEWESDPLGLEGGRAGGAASGVP